MTPVIWLDTRKETTTGPDKGRYHIKIKISIPAIENGKKVWKPKRAKTFVYATKKEFQSIMGAPRAKELQEKRHILDEKYKKAKDICQIENLSPQQYISLMENTGNFESITGIFDWYAEKLDNEERIGNARAIRSAKQSFVEFKGSDYIAFSDVTVEWLNRYKKWMIEPKTIAKGKKKIIKKEKSLTTVYIYCRALRSILHLAVDPLKKINASAIPFGKGKFKIPASKKKNRKVNFTQTAKELIAQKNLILKHRSSDDKVNKALNYWKASYFGNGCNAADLAHWKIGDYKNQMITFERKKTENTEEDNDTITVYVGEQLKQIIKAEGNKSLDPEEYIFPIINRQQNAKQKYAAIKQFIKDSNKYLKKAAAEMDLQIPLTTGTARYLMSTILKRMGIDMHAIKDMLGHESVATTEHYADGTDIDLMKSINKLLG